MLARSPSSVSAMIPAPGTALLQRKCACGGAKASLSGRCPECERKKLTGVQPKLVVGRADDPLEQDADRAADAALAHTTPPRVPPTSPALQRHAIGSTGDQVASPSVRTVLSTDGAPLPPALQHDMEQRFNHDFSHVRIHTDTAAAHSAHEIDAHAYTSGTHIAFASGAFAPGTLSGRRLLAHELAHVIQQGGASDVTPYIARAWNGCGTSADCPPRTPGEIAQASKRPWLVAQLMSPEPGQLVAHFDIGSSDTGALARNALWLDFVRAISGGNLHWEVLGFSDCAGPDAGNRGLRQARADAVAALLPPAARTKIDRILGADLSDCVAENDSADFRALNRSVVFHSTGTFLNMAPETVQGERPPYICGPDVTRQVQQAVADTRTAFAGWNSGQRDDACDALDSLRHGSCAWDIVELHNNSWIYRNFRPACATQGASPPCGETVQLGTECFYSGSPNYVIFGTMCKLCAEHYLSIPLINTGYARFTRNAVSQLIDIYKGTGVTGFATPSSNYRESLAWAQAGYDGWPSGGTPPAGDRPGCAPLCNQPYPGSFRVHWYPNLPLETC